MEYSVKSLYFEKVYVVGAGYNEIQIHMIHRDIHIKL